MDNSDFVYADILEELECPICTNYMTPPIRQCETGHSLCEPCMKKLPKCALCQTNFTNAKNISLQALAHKVYYPCTNYSQGCNAKLKLAQRENHEKNCIFRGFKCAMENCGWIGTSEEIISHWLYKGNEIRTSVNRVKTLMSTDSYFVNLANAYGRLFWTKRKLEKGRIYWAVQLIGPANEALKYYYEIDIYESESSKCRITLKDYCKSIEFDNDKLFSRDVCITTVSTDYLGHFIKKDHTLFYYVRIYEA